MLLLSLALTFQSHFASAQTFVVNLAGNLHNSVNERVGLCLNHLRDKDGPDLRRAVTENRLASLRFNEGELGDYWVFDPGHPNQALARPNDPALWFSNKNVDARGCWEATLQLDDFNDLLQATRASGYFIFAIDPCLYTGTADATLAEETKAQRLEWLKQTARALALHIRKHGIPITHIEIGNEQNLPGRIGRSGVGGRWTASEYGEVAAALADVFHENNPALRVGVNGMPGNHETWYGSLLPKVKGKADFLVTHSYCKSRGGYAGWRDGAGRRYDNAVRIAKMELEKQGMRLPIAVTEFNCLDANGPHSQHWQALATLNMILQHMRHPELEMMHYWCSRWMTEGWACNLFAPDSYQLSTVGKGVGLFTQCAQSRLTAYGDTDASRINWAGTVNPARGEATVFLINRKDLPQPVTVALSGFAASAANTVLFLRSPGDAPTSLNNRIADGTPVRLQGGGTQRTFTMELPAISAAAIRFARQQQE